MPTDPNLSQNAPNGKAAGSWSITGSVANTPEEALPPATVDLELDAVNLRNQRKVSRDRGRWELRAKLRKVSTNERTRGCGARCVSEQGAAIEVRMLADGAKARWLRLLRCGHVWTCPVCASEIRARRREQVTMAVRTGKAETWRMLTLTVRHHAGVPLKLLLDGLMRSWRKTRQQGAVQRLWKARVLASIRAVEVTHGENGWHPHLHILVQSAAWTAEERATLISTWRRVVVEQLGAPFIPDADVGAKWSPPVKSASDAGYLSKLGLEMSWGEKRVRAGRSRSPWTIARHGVDGDEPSQHLWREYEAATRGRRALELDDRAAKLAKEGADAELLEALDSSQHRCKSCGHTRAEHFTKSEHGEAGCCGRTRRRACACLAFVAPDRLTPPGSPVELIDVESHAVWLLRRAEVRLPGIMWHVLRAIEDTPRGAREVFDGWVRWAAAAMTTQPIVQCL